MTHKPTPKQLVERFWSRVDKRKPEECWPWKATLFNTGYGMFYAGEKTKSGNPKSTGTHRFIAELKIGRRLKKDEWALHECDNKNCCNPKHIYVGDHDDNMKDRQERNRTSRADKHSQIIKESPGIIAMRGSRNHQSKLTEEIVRESRKLCASGKSNPYRESVRHSVHPSTMKAAIEGKTWRYIDATS